MEEFLVKAAGVLKLDVIVVVFCLGMIGMLVKWVFEVFNKHIEVLNKIVVSLDIHSDRATEFQRTVQEQHTKMTTVLDNLNVSICTCVNEFKKDIILQNSKLDDILKKN